ncbi:MAG: response regulator [Lentimicrobium sp.]|nr:response regulator [Lentimicrobium sp.]
MSNSEQKNKESSVFNDNPGLSEFGMNFLPMAVTSISGQVLQVNRAFSDLTDIEISDNSKPFNLFELLEFDPSENGAKHPGQWVKRILKTPAGLKESYFSFNDIKSPDGNIFRINIFIDKGKISVPDASVFSEDESETIDYQISENITEIYSSSGIGFWNIHFSEDTAIKTINLFNILGIEKPDKNVSIDDVLHKSNIHPDDLDEYNKLLDKVKKQNRTNYAIDYRIIDGKGVVRYIHNQATLKYNNQGKLVNWSGTLQDVSSYRKSESIKTSALQISQLIHSQHNMELLMKAIHQVISSLMPAPDMHIALTEEGEQEIVSYCLNEEVGSPEKRKPENGLVEYVLKSKESLLVSGSAIELMIGENIISHSGQIPQSWIGIPLKTRETVIGVLCLQSHNSETTYSEEEKSILRFVAEQIALAIQKIKDEELLIKAKNSAENSSRLKSSLLANMSHELRTPMTGILGFSEILNEELDDPRLKSMAGTIFKSAGRLMSTLNSIIDCSALEADKNSLSLKSVSTRLMFQPLLKVAYSIASDKGLYLRTSIPPDLFVKADEKLLSQLIHHLIDNALKFTVDGGISISAYKLDKKSTTATIRISDTGIGIAAEHHRMIFEDFRQVSEGFSRTFEGSGLGLSLCSKIARLLNAKIWMDSIEGKGSDFYVEVPLASLEEAEAGMRSDAGPEITTKRLGKGSVPDVLIVEDNDVNRRLAALYLRELCNTEMAENGYVALEKIKRRKYDAILMDINLGAGPDGLTIAQQVRSFETNKDTPIIAVTGYTMHGDREKLLANGCSHYLPKPYDKQTLLKLFSRILYG